MAQFFKSGGAWVLGFAVLVSYSTLAGVTGGSLAGEASPATLPLGRILQIAICLAVALASAHGGSPVRSRALQVAATVACGSAILFPLLTGLTGSTPVSNLLVSLGQMLRQCGYVFLWLAWMELLARLDLRHALVSYLLVHTCSAALSFALGSVPVRVLVPLIVLMPVLAYVAYRKSCAVIESAPYACGEQEAHPWKFPTVPVVLMVAFATVNVFVRDTLPDGTSVYATAGVVVACLAVFAAVRKGGVGSFDIWRLGDAAFVLSLCGLVGVHLSSTAGSMVASLCTNAGFALFNVFLIVALCNVSYRYGVNSMVLFGFAKAAECLAYFAGSWLTRLSGALDGDGFALLVMALAVLLGLGFTALARGRGHDPSWGVGFDPSAPLRPESGPTLEQRCAALSREAGLTRREEEVLGLLARDMSASEIEQALCVTNATVKTHTQAVYRKLGVHSRREIVGLVDAGTNATGSDVSGVRL